MIVVYPDHSQKIMGHFLPVMTATRSLVQRDAFIKSQQEHKSGLVIETVRRWLDVI
jgi:hypothetical protein